jgi:hypothetical protein
VPFLRGGGCAPQCRSSDLASVTKVNVTSRATGALALSGFLPGPCPHVRALRHRRPSTRPSGRMEGLRFRCDAKASTAQR